MISGSSHEKRIVGKKKTELEEQRRRGEVEATESWSTHLLPSLDPHMLSCKSRSWSKNVLEAAQQRTSGAGKLEHVGTELGYCCTQIKKRQLCITVVTDLLCFCFAHSLLLLYHRILFSKRCFSLLQRCYCVFGSCFHCLLMQAVHKKWNARFDCIQSKCYLKNPS